MLIAFGERDEAAYHINKSLEDMFITASYHGKIRFDQVWKSQAKIKVKSKKNVTVC